MIYGVRAHIPDLRNLCEFPLQDSNEKSTGILQMWVYPHADGVLDQTTRMIKQLRDLPPLKL